MNSLSSEHKALSKPKPTWYQLCRSNNGATTGFLHTHFSLQESAHTPPTTSQRQITCLSIQSSAKRKQRQSHQNCARLRALSQSSHEPAMLLPTPTQSGKETLPTHCPSLDVLLDAQLSSLWLPSVPWETSYEVTRSTTRGSLAPPAQGVPSLPPPGLPTAGSSAPAPTLPQARQAGRHLPQAAWRRQERGHVAGKASAEQPRPHQDEGTRPPLHRHHFPPTAGAGAGWWRHRGRSPPPMARPGAPAPLRQPQDGRCLGQSQAEDAASGGAAGAGRAPWGPWTSHGVAPGPEGSSSLFWGCLPRYPALQGLSGPEPLLPGASSLGAAACAGVTRLLRALPRLVADPSGPRVAVLAWGMCLGVRQPSKGQRD